MSILGNLKTVRFPELLSALHQLKKTGILSVVSDREERNFLVYAGDIVFATPKDPTRRLGTFLVRLGLLSEEDLVAAESTAGGSEVYFGQRMIEEGRITEKQLRSAVKEQILDVMEEVLSWPSGAFHFDEDQIPFAIPSGVPISTQSLLLHAATRSDERRMLRTLFPDTNVIFAKSPGGTEPPEQPDTQDVLSQVDGKRTVEQILFSSPLDMQSTVKVLHELVESGHLQQIGVRPPTTGGPTVPELPCFPVAPDVPGKLFSAFNSEELQLEGVASVVAQDPLLTAKILKLLTLGKIEVSRAQRSVENIVEQLGTFRLKSVLIPEAIRGLFFPQARFFWKEWWEHSAVVARLSRLVAGPVGYPFPEEAYLAGLLHNLGAFILMRGDPEKYRRLVTEAASSKTELEELEEKVFGVSHSRAGTVYAEKWNFPKSLVHVIRLHHRIETDSRNLLLNIIAVAQGVAAAHGYGVEYVPSLEPQFELALRQLHIPRHRAIALLGRSRQPSRTVPNHEPTR